MLGLGDHRNISDFSIRENTNTRAFCNVDIMTQWVIRE